MRELPFYTNWSYAHPRAIELAAEVASLAPGDLNRVFFVSGGSEAVESAWKLARQYYSARGEKRVEPALARARGADHDAIVAAARRGPRRWKAISRHVAYHGTTMGALSINGIPALRDAVRAARARGAARPQHEPLPPPAGGDRGGVHARSCSTTSSRRSRRRARRRSAMVIMEPVQNAGGAFTPPDGLLAGRARALRPLRHPALRRRGDHRLRPARRTGSARSATTSGPTSSRCAKGLSSSYASIGAVIATDRVMEPFLEGDAHVLARHHVRRPPGAVRRSRSRTSRS